MRLTPKLWCFFGVHEDEIVRDGRLKIYGFGDEVIRIKHYYDLRCKVCGRLRTKNV